MDIRHVLIGTDGSEGATLALRWAADLARQLGNGVEVLLVHAVGLLTTITGLPEPSGPHLEEIEALLAGPWSQPLRDAGVRYRAEARPGNPVMVLLEAAKDFDADLVVVGSRGTGGFSGLHLGSSSHQVAQHSDRPVVIVPPAR